MIGGVRGSHSVQLVEVARDVEKHKDACCGFCAITRHTTTNFQCLITMKEKWVKLIPVFLFCKRYRPEQADENKDLSPDFCNLSPSGF
jgi:hypothetical protein